MIIVHSQWLSFPYDHGYVPLIIFTVPSSLLHSSFITRFLAKSNTTYVTSRAGTTNPSVILTYFPFCCFCCSSVCSLFFFFSFGHYIVCPSTIHSFWL